MKKNTITKLACFLISIATIIGIYTFIVIPAVEKEQKELYEKKLESEMYSYINVLTYKGDTPLLENSIITEAISSYFDVVKMPVGCVTSDYVSNFDDICGLQIEYAICKGQQVSYRNFKKFLKEANGTERLKEFNIYSVVAGQAMPGRYADILLRYPDGSSAVVVPKIQIYDIKYPEENEVGEEKELYTVVFAVKEVEHEDLVNAMKEGVLDMRIYLNDSQEPSVKTYIPTSVINKGGENGIS